MISFFMLAYPQLWEKPRKLQGFDQAVQKFVSEQSVTFADDVEKQIVGKMNLLKENLENKQENVKRFESFIRDLAACKDAYRKLA